MVLKFTKMHGLGNDFVVLDGIEQDIEPDPAQIRAMADRHFGIGCDQVLLIQPSTDPQADVRYRIFNADGDEVGQCGNGARCLGVYLTENGIVSGDVITAGTMSGNITIYREGTDRIRVNMGVPLLEPAGIPIHAEHRSREYLVDLSSGKTPLMVVSMGNPHAVLIVDDVDQAPVAMLGPEIQAHPMFPRGVNVGFMQILDAGHIRLRVYERGAGETLACGSGACAAAVTGQIANRLGNEVDIGVKGGHLSVAWAGEGEPVWMTGPATIVYTGIINL